ncbi:hypothetical protein BJF93_22270 [Xaviernesmea oryzae]|uniref:HTH cro/C1-type domain-containing protein n=1 Tax=Xaviernesmea oryzae TaxID=464029 RepID=A0A1Q9AYQ1_9HYPH|nr:helix-turn-helix transcriptional regulator [Xaviernesmea oryzae]OLP60555.1 hypothetical protein BJF93_22270 [Xaviernesmea oryzae]SEM29126.1 Helix-turn-helix [Xaviernesmea oryzae]
MRLSMGEVQARLGLSGQDDTAGGRLWRARDALGLSAEMLAERLGLTVETVSAWESDRAEPSAAQLFPLAALLNVTPIWLTEGSGVGPLVPAPGEEARRLRQELALVKKLHEETARAISALELAVERVLNEKD